MTGPRFLVGIDGGGSTVRVAVATPALDVAAQSEGGAANPSAIGREAAAESIRGTLRAALDAAGVGSTRALYDGRNIAPP